MCDEGLPTRFRCVVRSGWGWTPPRGAILDLVGAAGAQVTLASFAAVADLNALRSACKGLCQANEKCAAYVFHQCGGARARATCWLKGGGWHKK